MSATYITSPCPSPSPSRRTVHSNGQLSVSGHATGVSISGPALSSDAGTGPAENVNGNGNGSGPPASLPHPTTRLQPRHNHQHHHRCHCARKEMRLAVTLIAMTSVHVFLYSLLAFSWQLLYLDNLLGLLDQTTRLFVFRVGRIAHAAALLVRLWNFYVYFIRYGPRPFIFIVQTGRRCVSGSYNFQYLKIIQYNWLLLRGYQ